MSSVNPTKTKKKMASAPVDQFEDAEEEDEETESEKGTESPTVDSTKSAKEDDTADKKPSDPEEKKPEAADPPSSKEETESPAADADGSDPPATKEDATNDGEKDDEKDKEDVVEKASPPKIKLSSPTVKKGTEGKKKEKKTKKYIERTPATPPDSPTTTPEPEASKESDSSSSPLDALAAIASVANQKQKKKTTTKDVVAGDGKPPKEGTRVKADDICCADVLCGRGGQSNHHPGNIFFRRLVRAKQEEYLKANKREKTVVAKDIVKLIRMLTPPGRFLKKDPKNETVYVDVGDIQARNKASQALREGAPELREELRDQHSRMNAERGGGPEVKLPYHGTGRLNNAASAEGGMPEEVASRQAAAAAAHGMYLPAFAAADARAAAALRARADPSGKSDPPDGSEPHAEEGSDPARSAAIAHMAAEERARRLMFASMAGGHPGMGAHHFPYPQHMGLGGMGGMNPFLGGHSAAAAAQLAALQAGGGQHFGYPPAFMMAAAAHHQQPSAAALYQASRARDLASQIEAANYAAASGMNPMFLAAQQQAAEGKRAREAAEPEESEERHAKAAKVNGKA